LHPATLLHATVAQGHRRFIPRTQSRSTVSKRADHHPLVHGYGPPTDRHAHKRTNPNKKTQACNTTIVPDHEGLFPLGLRGRKFPVVSCRFFLRNQYGSTPHRAGSAILGVDSSVFFSKRVVIGSQRGLQCRSPWHCWAKSAGGFFPMEPRRILSDTATHQKGPGFLLQHGHLKTAAASFHNTGANRAARTIFFSVKRTHCTTGSAEVGAPRGGHNVPSFF